MWKRIDQILTRWEKKGFKTANNLHIYSINFLLICAAYQGYAFLRDYNSFFLTAREDDNEFYKEGLEPEQEYPLNKNIPQRKNY